MNRFFVVIFFLCVIKHTNAYSCFRDPWMMTSKCGCPDFSTPCGDIQYLNTCNNACSYPACFHTVSNCNCGLPIYSSTFCECGQPTCSCYLDSCDVCFVCDNPTPLCSCLKTVRGDCGCEEMRSFIFFPEVEYPITAIDVKPFYYAGCCLY